MQAPSNGLPSLPLIERRIITIRHQRVMIDADLAELYGVPTKALNQAVKRNPGRFPPDFVFNLNPGEKSEVVTNCDHLARLKFSRTLPFAFTEHGAIQAANVIASARAAEMSVYIVRAFIHLRELVISHADLARRLSDVELGLDDFQLETREQIREILQVLHQLMSPPAAPRKRPIGFVTPVDEGDEPRSHKRGNNPGITRGVRQVSADSCARGP
jgi:hypothetical protein